jgi:hypothetical protein
MTLPRWEQNFSQNQYDLSKMIGGGAVSLMFDNFIAFIDVIYSYSKAQQHLPCQFL